MHLLNKKHIPFVFLIVISVFWGFFYQSTHMLNAFGGEKSEWFLFIDGLIVLPLLCFFCIDNKKEAALKALAYTCLVVVIGSYVIPENSKFVWSYLESGRFVALAAIIFIEVTTVITVFLAIKSSLDNDEDPDKAIAMPIKRFLGDNMISSVMAFEARVWTYLLFSKKIDRNRFIGDEHFFCYKKDGTQHNQLGFILITIFEIPIMHILLHFVWSPAAANVVTILSLLGLAFMIADYKAMAIRPISMTANKLIIRYGIFNPLSIPFEEIVAANVNNTFIPRDSKTKRFNITGNPNIALQLQSGRQVYLGVDSPNEFIRALAQRVQ